MGVQSDQPPGIDPSAGSEPAPAAPAADISLSPVDLFKDAAGLAGDVARAPTLIAKLGAIEEDTKKYLKSRTLWALAVSALAAWAKGHGHDISGADQALIVTDVLGLVQYGALAAAALFRVLATKRLT